MRSFSGAQEIKISSEMVEMLNLFQSPPDISESIRRSRRKMLFKDEETETPYSMWTPIEQIDKMHIGTQTYFNVLQCLIWSFVALFFIYSLPSTVYNFWVYFSKLDDIQKEPGTQGALHDFFFDVLIRPIKQTRDPTFITVLIPFKLLGNLLLMRPASELPTCFLFIWCLRNS